MLAYGVVERVCEKRRDGGRRRVSSADIVVDE